MTPARQFPYHIGVIMDGNGRWATARGLPRIFGHRAGADAVRRTVEAACDLGVQVLTLYAFSWENWDRPREEIHELMGLLDEFIKREAQTLRTNHIRLRAIGRIDQLPGATLGNLRRLVGETAGYDRMTLVLALSYGGRQEIVDTVRRLAALAQQGALQPEQIDEALISRSLYTADLPDPDLIIRTSGEQRISNFLLWQASYAEFYVTPKLWPEFSKTDLMAAIHEYERRERRFGKTMKSPRAAPRVAATPRLEPGFWPGALARDVAPKVSRGRPERGEAESRDDEVEPRACPGGSTA